MSFIEKTILRNKNIISSLLIELEIKESYEYLISDAVLSLFFNLEKEKSEQDKNSFKRARLIIKIKDDDKTKRKTIKNLTLQKDTKKDESNKIVEQMKVLSFLFKEQNLLTELNKIEDSLINKYSSHLN